MRIREAIGDVAPDPEVLMGLVSFLNGRAEDTNAVKEISQDAFINLANSLDIPITKQNLANMINQPPLSNVLEPLTPGTIDPIRYKGAGEINVAMPVNKAQDIVAKAAKSAMNRDRGV